MPKRQKEKPKLAYSTQYLEFYWVMDSPSGKTSVWNVCNKQGEPAGQIAWKGAWRRYVFYSFRISPFCFDALCLRDVVDFLNARMEERAERKAIQEESKPKG